MVEDLAGVLDRSTVALVAEAQFCSGTLLDASATCKRARPDVAAQFAAALRCVDAGDVVEVPLPDRLRCRSRSPRRYAAPVVDRLRRGMAGSGGYA
jgi:hypothetical protein